MKRRRLTTLFVRVFTHVMCQNQEFRRNSSVCTLAASGASVDAAVVAENLYTLVHP